VRQMSFAATTQQILDRSKTVTRRKGWHSLTPGTLLQPIVKGQGLKKGETVVYIGGPIRVVSVSRQRLSDITAADVCREGFPQLRAREFVQIFKKMNGGRQGQFVTRIAFEYVDEADA
jgi:hypothetical protein